MMDPPPPDFSVFIVSGRGLNLERGVLSGERGSKDRSSLQVTSFYGSGQFYTGFLYTHKGTQTSSHR